MKLQQLRYALEIYRHNLNVSAAADSLFTSQPGVSKQIRLLEEELGVQIFIRSGKRIISVSQPGKAVLTLAERVLHDIHNIKNIGKEFADHDSGILTIATTHTQALHALPSVVSDFVKHYPKVQLSIKQGSPLMITQMVLSGEADFAITTESLTGSEELRSLPCSKWTHGIIVPDNHPLLEKDKITINDIAVYPLVTYEFAFNNNSSIAHAFRKAKIDNLNIVLAAVDTGVLKTYVKLGLGIGLMAQMAFDAETDQGLQMIDASHLFEPCYTAIALRPDSYLRGYTYAFINMFAPELTKDKIDKVLYEPIEEDFSI